MRAPWRETGEGIELAVRVTPRGGGDRVTGVVEDAAGGRWLAVRIAAPAEGGRANAAVRRLLARGFGVPVSAVELLAGATSRRKRFRIRGAAVALRERAVALTAEGAGDGRQPRRHRRGGD